MEKKEAINIFDFDGTLTTETWPKYWVWVKKFGFHGECRNEKLEEALALYRARVKGTKLETFFAFFDNLLVSNNQVLTWDELLEGEKYITYYQGLEEFLANDRNKKYIISGGLKDFLERTSLARYFDGIYGTQVIVNGDDQICGIGKALRDEDKVEAIKDILKINGRSEDDCQDVFFIGDGYSDFDSLRYTHIHGGKAIFVHPDNDDDLFYEHNQKIYERLNAGGMIDYKCLADYREGTELYKILKREDGMRK